MSETTSQRMCAPMDATTLVRAVEVFVLERMVDGVEDSSTQTNKRVSVVLTVDHERQVVSVTPKPLMVPLTDRYYDRSHVNPLVLELWEGDLNRLREWEAMGTLIRQASEEGAARMREQNALRAGGKPNKELY